MKKILTLLLAFALMVCCAACAARPPQEDAPQPPAPAPAAEGEATAEPAGTTAEPAGTTAEPAGTGLSFSTTALDGAAVDESILAGHALTMVNFFEPWCPPCVAELPELEKLYETYAPATFQILGVFSTEEGIEAVLEKAGVSYPILRYVPAFDPFQTGYVPTTIFLDEQGNVVGETQIGANSYEGWEAIVRELLG